MEIAREMQTLAPIIVINGVEYGDYPSVAWDKVKPTKDIDDIEDSEMTEGTTNEDKYSMDPYTLTSLDIKNIIDEFRETIEYDSHGDIDGYPYEIDYKMYSIDAIHHYRCHEDRGGDSYCGVWEMVGVVDEDRIEVVKVFDEDGIEYPDMMRKLNEYAKIKGI